MFKHFILSFLKALLGNHVYTIRHGLGKGLKIKGGMGFLKFHYNTTPEEHFLLSLHFDSKTIYDIGSHVGITTMFFAKSVGPAGKVIAFEPNPSNVIALKRNIALNNLDNISIMEMGLGKQRETKVLVYDPNALATGSMNHSIQAQLMKAAHKKVRVEIYPLDHFIATNTLPVPSMIKIDVEGMEYEVLLGMRTLLLQYKPQLFIELHGIEAKNKRENAQKVFHLLDSLHYSVYHVETKQNISSQNIQTILEGHFYCN